nr:MBOAT family O-acyltransferase [Malonomonas rubra]
MVAFMSLTSFPFFIFYLVIFFVCLLVEDRNEQKKTVLILASYYFYMTIDWRFSFLLLSLTAINYFCGSVILRSNSQRIKKIAVSAALLLSLSILFYFKYANFFIDSVLQLLSFSFFERDQLIIQVVLPVGISFMTFQAITYPLDIYAERIKSSSSIKDFVLFMSFFPQLLSGPIVRASYFLPQLKQTAKANNKNLSEGLVLVVSGLVKKIIIADILAVQIVDPAFNTPHEYSSAFLVFSLVAFSFQIYMDLSGYTDIALGTGKMLGYDLPINFNRPYIATSVANYWQRWHISMSSFFRDYLYGAIADWSWCNLYIKVLIVFVAVGLWHGAGWNFVVYGLIHGSFVGLEHFFKNRRLQANKPPYVYRGFLLGLRVFQVFSIVSLTRILFRCDDVASAFDYVVSMFTSSVEAFPVTALSACVLALSVVTHFVPVKWKDLLLAGFIRLPVAVSAGVATLIIYLMIALDTNKSAFLYFQF